MAGGLHRDFRRPGVLHEFGVVVGRFVLALDAAVFFGTCWLMFDARQWLGGGGHLIDCLIAVAVGGFASSTAFGRSWRTVRLRREIFLLVLLTTVAFAATLLVFFVVGRLPDTAIATWAPAAARWYAVLLAIIVAARVLVRVCLRYVRAFGFDSRTAAFVGATAAAEHLQRTFDTHGWMGMKVLGTFAPANERGSGDTGQRSVDELVALAREGMVSHVYITMPMRDEDEVRAIIERLSDTTASVYYCPPMESFDLVGGRWDAVFGQPVISVVETPFLGFPGVAKRIEDLAIVALALPVLIVPLAIIAAAVRLTSPGPAIYRQRRFGLDGKPFVIFKFRTMSVIEGDGEFVQARRGDDRITAIGRFLRRTSLDELPQLFNVLNGSMSIIGPRPHPIKLNDEYRSQVRRYMVRHKIRPGITGLAQVSGARGETATVDKMNARISHDLEYMRSWSILLDLRILLRTLILPFADKNAF